MLKNKEIVVFKVCLFYVCGERWSIGDVAVVCVPSAWCRCLLKIQKFIVYSAAWRYSSAKTEVKQRTKVENIFVARHIANAMLCVFILFSCLEFIFSLLLPILQSLKHENLTVVQFQMFHLIKQLNQMRNQKSSVLSTSTLHQNVNYQ